MGASYLYTIEFHKHSTLHPPVSVIIKHWKRWRLIKGLFHYRFLEVLVVARGTYVVCLMVGESPGPQRADHIWGNKRAATGLKNANTHPDNSALETRKLGTLF